MYIIILICIFLFRRPETRPTDTNLHPVRSIMSWLCRPHLRSFGRPIFPRESMCFPVEYWKTVWSLISYVYSWKRVWNDINMEMSLIICDFKFCNWTIIQRSPLTFRHSGRKGGGWRPQGCPDHDTVLREAGGGLHRAHGIRHLGESMLGQRNT